MISELDLHGVKHPDVKMKVENLQMKPIEIKEK